MTKPPPVLFLGVNKNITAYLKMVISQENIFSNSKTFRMFIGIAESMG